MIAKFNYIKTEVNTYKMASYHCKTMDILKYTWNTAINVHDKDISVTLTCQIMFQHFVTFHDVVRCSTYFQSPCAYCQGLS